MHRTRPQSHACFIWDGSPRTDTAAETPEELKARLHRLVKTSDCHLFMKGTPDAPRCGFSRKIVDLLRSHNVAFTSFDILEDDAVRQGLKKEFDWPTFPQLYVRGELRGGLEIITEEIDDVVAELAA